MKYLSFTGIKKTEYIDITDLKIKKMGPYLYNYFLSANDFEMD